MNQRLLYKILTAITTLAVAQSVCGSLPWDYCLLQEPVDSSGSSIPSLYCIVPNGSIWDMNDLERWLNSSAMSVSSEYTVKLECNRGGKVVAPWPMKATRLKEIEIVGCEIEGFLRELINEMGGVQSTMASLPDELESIRLFNSVVVINPLELQNAAMGLGSISSQVDCGSLNLKELRFRGLGTKYEIPMVQSPEDGNGITTSSVEMSTDLPSTKLAMQTEAFVPETTENLLLNAISTQTEAPIPETTEQLLEVGVPTHRCPRPKLKHIEISNSDFIAMFNILLVFSEGSILKGLETLDFSNVYWTEVPNSLYDYDQSYPKLRYVNLTHNAIEDFKVPEKRNARFNRFKLLDLAYNQIKILTEKQIKAFASPEYIHVNIRGNPISCTCNDTLDVLTLLQNNKTKKELISQDYGYLYDMKCASPSNLQHKTLGTLTVEDLLCPTVEPVIKYQSAKTPWILLGVLSFLLIVMVVLVIKWRLEIRILLFTRLGIKWGMKCLTGNKVYDAFISYNQADYKWVCHTLAPKLEDSGKDGPGFKLCLHQRDFPVGHSIAETIVDTVEKSRHTVLILSQNFLNSEWCMMEFRTAFYQSLKERRKHLIAILLEEIPLDKMDSDLRSYLRTTTYLSVNDRLFWDKLIFALSTEKASLEPSCFPCCARKDKGSSTVSNATVIVPNDGNKNFDLDTGKDQSNQNLYSIKINGHNAGDQNSFHQQDNPSNTTNYI